MGEIRMGIVSPDILKSAPSVKAVRSVLLGSVYLQDGTVAPIEKALEGTDDKLRMTPFTTRAVIDEVIGSAGKQSAEAFATAEQGQLADNAVQKHEVGTAAQRDVADFATATQGELAETAVQPQHIGSAAKQSVEAFATAAQGAKADNAVLEAAELVRGGVTPDRDTLRKVNEAVDKALPKSELPIFASRETVASQTVAPEINALRINEAALPRAGKGGLYIPRSSNPGHSGSVQDASGKWFEQVTADLPYSTYRTSVLFTPSSYTVETGGFPSAGPNLSIVIAPGGDLTNVVGFNRSTVIGTQTLQKAENFDRIESFGSGNLRKLKQGERITAIGSIVGELLGIQQDEVAASHNFWYNAGGFQPGQPGWDYGGLETENPGIGQKLADFTAYASAKRDNSRLVLVGRDVLNATVKAEDTVAMGYRALGGAFVSDRNTAVGGNAFNRAIFQSQSSAFGFQAGFNWQEGERNTVIGLGASRGTFRGSNNTTLGTFAASEFTDANGSVFLGYGAGNGMTLRDGTPITKASNLLGINNTTGIPLISGDFFKYRAGINIVPGGQIKGTFHVRTGDFGPEASPNAFADDLIVENNDSVGMTLRSPAGSSGSVLFARPDFPSIGGMIYRHANDNLELRAGGQTKIVADATGVNLNGNSSVNIAPGSAIKGTFHVFTAAYRTDGVDAAASVNADDLVIENSGNTGITMRSPNNAFCSILMSDPESTSVGGLVYGHTLNQWEIKANGITRVFVNPTGIGFNGSAAYAKPTLAGAATDAATTMSLVNDIRNKLITYGLAA